MSATISAAGFRRQFQQLRTGLDVAAQDSLTEVLADTETVAKTTSLYQDRTGRLRRETKAIRKGAYAGEVIANAPYAVFVNSGTKAHEIVPHGRFLSFMVNGARVFARKVQHPGTAPRPFMDQAAAFGKAVAGPTADKHAGAAIAAFNR